MGQCISGGNKVASETTRPQRAPRQQQQQQQQWQQQQQRQQQQSGSVPDLQPPRRRRDDVIRDPSIFQKVDQHALNAPSSARSSVEALASYLVQPASSDLEKARAFFRWISNNISYATDQFFSGRIASCDAESVLRSGSSVCQGYAELFLALCNHAQIPCRVVSGFAKGFSYKPENPFTPTTRTNHAWNLVCVQGEWRPVECTWASGHVSGTAFVKEYKEIYFLTDPEDFIIEHFPYMNDDVESSARFQLLKKPWDLDTFNRKVKVAGPGLECGLRTLTHDGWNIPMSKEVVVKVRTDRMKIDRVMAKLHQNNTEVQGSVLVRKGKDSSFSVTVRPPSPGKYMLEIYGESKEKGHFNSMVTYVINCTEAMADLHPYPKDRRTQYGPMACAEEYGLGADARALDVLVSTDGTLDFKISLKREMPALFKLTYAEGDIPDLDHHVMATYGDKSMQVHARLPRAGFYKLTVFGKHPAEETNRHDEVLHLLLECLKAKGDCQPFPKSFGAARELRCTLVEPLSRYLPAHQQVKVQLTSPLLKRMLPDSVKQDGNTWRGVVETKGPGSELTLFGSKESDGSLSGLFEFLMR